MTGRDALANNRLTGRVLVVDDVEANRLLLRDLLEVRGHEVLEASDGAEALKLVAKSAPEVVLLDVQMPGIDGFEVCRRLKAAPATAALPVLLVTALSDRDHRLEGIRAGANDFITKPIDGADLMLRVRNALQTRRLFTEVETQYRKLEQLEALRDNLVHMVVHDLRSPLTAVYGNLQLIQLDVEPLGPDAAETLSVTLRSTQRIIDMVSDLLDVSRLEAGKIPLELEPVDLGVLAAETVRNVGAGARRIHYDPPAATVTARCDPKVIGRVITNLLDNAIKFTPDGAAVRITVALDQGAGARVAVHDVGPGIPAEAQEVIFQKFGQVSGVKQARRSSGLGLTFCKLAVEAHGGRIGVESVVGHGSTFWFVVPTRAT